MATIIQTIADAMYLVLNVFEIFLTEINSIPFINSGFSVLDLLYGFIVINEILGVFNTLFFGENRSESISEIKEI